MDATFKEFKKIKAPKIMVNNEAWVDISWHNDVTASAEFEIKKNLRMRVWVAEDDPNEREYAEWPKFMVEIDNESGNNILELENGDTYATAETEQELESLITKLIDKYF